MKSGLGRPKKAANRDTKQAILDAALDLFSEKGFPDTSVREIARAVGVTEAAIYSHFENKQAILDKLYEQYGPSRVIEFFESFDKKKLLKNPKSYLLEKIMSLFNANNKESEVDVKEFKVFKIHQTELFRLGGKPSCFLDERQREVDHIVLKTFQFLIDAGMIHEQYKSARVFALQLLAPMFLLRFEEFTGRHEKVEQSKIRKEHNKLMLDHLKCFLNLVIKEKRRPPEK